MSRQTLPISALCVLALVSTASAVGGTAQYSRPQPPPAAQGTPSLSGRLIKPGLYTFEDRSNSLLRLTANGLVVVDGQPSDHYEPLIEHVRQISEQPIRLLILTDHHRARTESNSQFLRSGTQLLAHENARKRLMRPNAQGPAGRILGYDRTYLVKLGGIEIQVLHFGRAHTDGDSVAYFPNLKVVAVGDLYATLPDPDFSSGGSLVGWSPVLASLLALDFDVVVPSVGPPVTRNDLTTFKSKIDTVVSRGRALVQAGVPKRALMAQLKTDDLGWHFDFTGARLDAFYAELSRGD